ncbi:MAG TPA: YbaK/EbsC family protein [Gaiellaceae bacterium]|nr:YbaK/EbsC family protein [Gaiellaceae bacterium]
MTREWPEPVARVVRVLQEAKVEARVEEFAEGTPTAEDAARAVGAALDEIVKSLVFSCDGRAVLVMVPGDRRADTGKIARALGCERVKSARPDAVAEATGFPAGGVAPFPLPRIETVLIDRSLLAHELVWIGAGSERHLAALAPADLVRLARARAVDAAAEIP